MKEWLKKILGVTELENKIKELDDDIDNVVLKLEDTLVCCDKCNGKSANCKRCGGERTIKNLLPTGWPWG